MSLVKCNVLLNPAGSVYGFTHTPDYKVAANAENTCCCQPKPNKSTRVQKNRKIGNSQMSPRSHTESCQQ